MRVKNFLKSWISISLCLFFCGKLSGATWNQDADANWNVDAYWISPATFPNAIGANAIFSNVITAPRAITLGQNITIGTTTFNNANSYTIQGANTLTFDMASGNATITSTTGNHTISSAVELNDPLIVAQNGGGGSVFTISGPISGTNSLRKNGNGVLTLSNEANSYLNTIMGGGTLRITSDGALGQANGSITFLGTSTLIPTTSITSNRDMTLGTGTIGSIMSTGDFTFNGKISGAGDMAILNNLGTFIPTNITNDYTGKTILNGAKLEISDPRQLGHTSQLNGIGGTYSNILTVEDMTIEAPIVFTGSRNGGLYLSSLANTTVNYSGDIDSSSATAAPAIHIRRGEGVVQLTGNNVNFSNIISIVNEDPVRPTLEIFALENLGNSPSLGISGGILKLSGNIISPPSRSFIISRDPLFVVAPGTQSEIQGVIERSSTTTSLPILQIESHFDATLGGGILNLSNPENLFQWGLSIKNDATVQIQQDGNLGLDVVDNFVELDNGSLEILPGSGIHSLNRPLTLLNGNGALILNDGTTNLWGGPLQGSGTLIITKPLADIGNAVFQLSGNSVGYTGNLIVNDITLQISTNDNLGSGSNLSLNGATLEFLSDVISPSSRSLTLTNSSIFLVDNGMTGIEGAIGGTGSLIKAGLGALTLSGNNTYPGLTNVQAGELRLNGQVAGDALVHFGALISGTGSVGGNLTVNGGIAPGNSIGILNVAGHYVQNAGSTYFLEINGLGQSDLIHVTGTAILNGGQVIVTSLDGSALFNTPYPILTAAGGVSGEFEGISTTNLLIIPTLVYDANNAYLLFVQTVFNFDAVTPNQIAVATQLESITDPTSEEFLILITLEALPAAEQQQALDEMSGVQYASLNLASEIASRQFLRRLYDPLRSIVTIESCNDDCCACPCPTLDLWLEAGGGQTFLNGNSHAHGLKLNGWEITGGVQSTFNRDWTIGIAGSYVEDCIKHDLGARGKNRMGFGAIYGLYRPSNFYVLTDLVFGSSEFSLTRSIDMGVLSYTAKGRPKHYHAIGYIEAGFDWNTCNFLIQPFLGFEGGYFRRNSFSESGFSPLNLRVNKQTYGNAFSRLGVHLTTKQWSSLKLSVDVAWDCRLTSNKRSITESFQDFGAPFTVTAISRNRNRVDAAATVITKLCNGWELYAEVRGEFWSKEATYNVLGGVKYRW